MHIRYKRSILPAKHSQYPEGPEQYSYVTSQVFHLAEVLECHYKMYRNLYRNRETSIAVRYLTLLTHQFYYKTIHAQYTLTQAHY